jgi:cytochrome c oxidase assembly factor CtaG
MMMLLGVLLLIATPAHAHSIGDAWSNEAAWTADPLILVPLYVFGIGFLIGNFRLWQNAGFNRGLKTWQVACFWAGWTILALALLSTPLEDQQLAGMIMWVPGCTIYAIAGLILLGQWISWSDQPPAESSASVPSN